MRSPSARSSGPIAQTLPLAMLLALPLLLAFACGEDQRGGVGEPCSAVGDCEAKLRCFKPRSPTSGETAEEGVCVAPCASDGDCRGGWTCLRAGAEGYCDFAENPNWDRGDAAPP